MTRWLAGLALGLAACAATPPELDADVAALAAHRDMVAGTALAAFRAAPTQEAKAMIQSAYGAAAASWNTVLHRAYVNVLSGADMAYAGDFPEAVGTAARRSTQLLAELGAAPPSADPAIRAALDLYAAYDRLDAEHRQDLSGDLLRLHWPPE